MTIVGAGTATITATVEEKEDGNYQYATTTASYTIGVATATMSVIATNYTGTYDGEAHGIGIEVPEGTVVKYGETEGSYPLDTAPTYTDAGSYTVFYQVTKPNYTTVNGSAVVTISKAAGTVSYEVASVNKTFSDAPFINPLTLTGDGTVSYATDNTAIVTVDSETGEVTIVGVGTVNITATVTDGANYRYATKTASYTIGVEESTMTILAEGYTGTYDGTPHGINVTVTEPEGAEVRYGTEPGSYLSDISPAYTDAGSYTVYYQVKKNGYTTVENSAVVSIAKALGTISYAVTSVSRYDTDESFINPIDFVGDGTVSYVSDNVNVATVNVETGEVAIVGIGDATITATVTDGTNYSYTAKTARYTVSVTEDPITGIDTMTGASESDVWYDLDGRRLPGRPTKKGVYLRNGRKTVVR